jgi:hypothetical protein
MATKLVKRLNPEAGIQNLEVVEEPSLPLLTSVQENLRELTPRSKDGF